MVLAAAPCLRRSPFCGCWWSPCLARPPRRFLHPCVLPVAPRAVVVVIAALWRRPHDRGALCSAALLAGVLLCRPARSGLHAGNHIRPAHRSSIQARLRFSPHFRSDSTWRYRSRHSSPSAGAASSSGLAISGRRWQVCRVARARVLSWCRRSRSGRSWAPSDLCRWCILAGRATERPAVLAAATLVTSDGRARRACAGARLRHGDRRRHHDLFTVAQVRATARRERICSR